MLHERQRDELGRVLDGEGEADSVRDSSSLWAACSSSSKLRILSSLLFFFSIQQSDGYGYVTAHEG